MRAIALVSLLVLPAPGTAEVFPFSTPSRNIECSAGLSETSADIRCTIHEKTGRDPRPRPANCSGAWGHIFWLKERGPVRMDCGGPGGRNTARDVSFAQYGETNHFGDITCLSSRSGFECRNADGHAFFLSRGKRSVK